MFDWPVQTMRGRERDGRLAAESGDAVAAVRHDEIRRHFQENYPILLDGALPRADDRGTFIHRAHVSLREGRVDPKRLPMGLLRDTLNNLAAEPQPVTQAGVTPVGPRHARVWWDEAVLDNLEDVISQLDRPRLVLRFYDVTGLDPDAGRWHESFDIDVEVGERGRTVQFWSGERVYAVDLGYIYADGRFLRLARTNTATLPRDSQGAAPTGETARSNLRPRGDRFSQFTAPDAAAREWAANRADSEDRDIEAELVIHMLYRAFLDEGPRALRRAPRLARREAGVLRREYAQRERNRERVVVAPRKSVPVFLVTRLDAARSYSEAPGVVYQMVPAARFGLGFGARYGELTGEGFAWYRQLLQSMRGARSGCLESLPRHRVTVTRVDAEEELEPAVAYLDSVRMSGAPTPAQAVPVFAAAENLRESLAGLRPLDAPVVDGFAAFSGHDRAVKPHAVARRESDDERTEREERDALRVFGGAEAKRMAKAGVRITRMALTLEGRMRPGARLKVAGKLVHADKDGNFRLECVLSGKRASIPMRAGTSIGGEARSLINVDWEKRSSRDRKKVSVE